MTTPTTPTSPVTMPPVGAPPAPKSKLSGAVLIVITIVVVLVLGGAGVLVAEAVKSEPTSPKPVGPAANPQAVSTGGAGRSARATSGGSASNSSTSAAKGKTKSTTSVKLHGGAATQPVPSGWTAKAGDNGNYVVLSKAGYWAYVEIAQSDAVATAQVSGMLTAWVVNDDHYSQVAVSDPKDLEVSSPFSTAANLGYIGLYTGNSGSASVFGVLIVFDRTDGLVLRMQLEAFSATSTDDAQARFKAQDADITTILGVIDSFAQSAT